MTVRSDLLRHRVEGLVDVDERTRLTRILDDLHDMDKVVELSTRWPKTLRRHGITEEVVERARWCAERLHEEIVGCLERSEATA